MTLRDNFARNVRRLRDEKDWSQEELAYQADISRTYVGNIENRKYAASLDVLEKVARAFGVKPAELLEVSARRKA